MGSASNLMSSVSNNGTMGSCGRRRRTRIPIRMALDVDR